jgi:hypothetical protein
MYYLFETHGYDTDELPSEKREWWWLVYQHQNKQTVLDWHNKYKRGYARKLVCTDSTIKECFYPFQEIKSNTATARILKSIGYK